MRSLRLAIAGAGAIGRAHALRIARTEGCELVALADPAPAAAALAAGLGVPRYAQLDELLERARPDGVILATPNALHVAGVLECLAAGVPALVEKPLADQLADARRLVDAVAASGVPVLVGHHRRHGAILARACAVIASGRLGRLVAVSASATFRKPDSYFEQGPWRREPGGGPILINLVHEIDSLRAMVGEIVEVQALASNAARGFAVEDTVAVGLRFAGGVLGTFVLSDAAAGPCSWEQTSGEDPRYDHHGDVDCCVVAGTRGTLMVPTMRLFSHDGESSWWLPLARSREALPEVDPLARQLAHFAAVVRREAAPLVTVDDAARTLAATLAVAEAARSGERVTLH
ncbi:MAG: Gfo/Idh/MocA family oxidoreductase [Burkholderiales bacterium]|nr:Gfo/Idh/MocA family oxidoreductase [Burkholderiales bacterium]MDE2276490.1 Gfo/Idh/MocA family oxidoreductase [Burkholderiales bacterium]